jgi:hypothetical protein
MANAPKPIVFDDLRGGRNDTDPPMKLPMNQATEFLNMDWKDATWGRKRGGATALSLTGGTAFGVDVASLMRHVPGASETAAELWGVDFNGLFKRLTAGVTWADVTLDDALIIAAYDVVGATLNGKLFLAYRSNTDRLHVYDPSLAAPRVRRVDIAPGASAPTVANTGGGAYAATLRYYRVRWTQISGATTVRKSEATAAVSFTPSGAGLAARVTRPAAPGEGETHWEIEASTDNATYYRLSQVVIATTTYDDSALVATYSSNTLSDAAGTYALFPSVKSLISDGNRLLGAGAWESSGTTSGGKNSRVWFTPVLGSTDKGDDERVPNTTTQKNWVDLNENDGGGVTGLGGPINGVPWAFKYRQIWKLRPTGDVNTPYLPRKVMDGIGCVEHKSIVVGEDHLGQPALYFMSHRGPYRITVDGTVQYLGRDNEVLWRTMNLAAAYKIAHSVYYPELHQWWVFVSTGSSDYPDTKMMFDVQRGFPDENGQIRGGWSKHTGLSCTAISSCLFADSVAASMGSNLKPYVGAGASVAIYKCDTSATDDAGTQFQATATTRPVQTTPICCGKSASGNRSSSAKRHRRR